MGPRVFITLHQGIKSGEKLEMKVQLQSFKITCLYVCVYKWATRIQLLGVLGEEEQMSKKIKNEVDKRQKCSLWYL